MEVGLTVRDQNGHSVAKLDAAPGLYQVRPVIREGVKGRPGASTAMVELRAQ
jgi:hypothetical protein